MMMMMRNSIKRLASCTDLTLIVEEVCLILVVGLILVLHYCFRG